MTTILDIPIEKQKELANKEGKSLEQWRESMERILVESTADAEAYKSIIGQRPEGWTKEMVEKFGDKMQSSCKEYNP